MCHRFVGVPLSHKCFQNAKKDIPSIDDKIIAIYAKGMTTPQTPEIIEDIYGFEASEGMESDITDKLLTRIEEWQNRPLSPIYPILIHGKCTFLLFLQCKYTKRDVHYFVHISLLCICIF